jgi:hypothetical protein
MIHELFGRIFTRIPAESASRLGGEVAHRLIIFGFTLLRGLPEGGGEVNPPPQANG